MFSYEIWKISGVGSREKQEACSTDGLWLMGKDTYSHQLLKLFKRTGTHLLLVFSKRRKIVIGADLWKYWIKGLKKKEKCWFRFYRELRKCISAQKNWANGTKVINMTRVWDGRDDTFELNMKANLPGSKGLMKISPTVTESFLVLKLNVLITRSILSKI